MLSDLGGMTTWPWRIEVPIRCDVIPNVIRKIDQI
jgi:hypothetical protein